jgi:molybdopterin-containing oxidoreductase family membrane subunit
MSIIVNIGMWFERFVIIVTSLHRDFLPSAWAMYTPTITEVSILIGSFGLFFFLYFLFCKFLPTINMAEVKSNSVSVDVPADIAVAEAILRQRNRSDT